MVAPLFISVTADVDKLARDVVTDDFDTPAVIKEQKAAYSKIYSATKKDWDDSADKRFPAVQKIEQQLAAAYLIQYYGSGSPDEIALMTELRVSAKDSLKEIIEESGDLTATDETLLIITSLFESYPASLEDNPNATPYRGTLTSSV
jgi:hypothetical protein